MKLHVKKEKSMSNYQKFDHIMSLGAACQVAYQIKRHFQQPTFFFDWVVTSHNALISIIKNNFPDVLTGQIEIADKREIFVRDRSTGLLFYDHDFPLDESKKISPGFGDIVPQVREKYKRRSDRMKQILESDKDILLIRHTYNEFPADAQRFEVETLFRTIYTHANIEFLWVMYKKSEEREGERALLHML
jgi:hypothetical protein